MAFLIIPFSLLLKLISALNIARPHQFPWASQSVVEIGTLSETFFGTHWSEVLYVTFHKVLVWRVSMANHNILFSNNVNATLIQF